MFSPEKQQIEICLLKSNLEEIESDLVVQRSTLPTLDAENEKQYQKSMTALQMSRSLNTEIERLEQENVRLTAKRMQLKRQCEDLTKSLDKARGTGSELLNLILQEEHEEDLEIRRYEESLREKAERFIKTQNYYNEEYVKGELEEVNNINTELESELVKRRNVVDELRRQLETLQEDVPQDLLQIMGKMELDEKVEILTSKCEALHEKRNYLLNSQSNTAQSIMRKY